MFCGDILMKVISVCSPCSCAPDEVGNFDQRYQAFENRALESAGIRDSCRRRNSG